METRETNGSGMSQRVELPSANWNNEVEEKAKKEKKWSIGKLFRRKKKETESDSSSSEESSQKSAKKKKSGSRRTSITRPTFDSNHQNENQRSQSVTKFTRKEYFDEGVLSDPSAGFVGYVGRGLPRSPFDRSHRTSKESLDRRGLDSSCGSQEGSLRKGRKGRIKARVEAIRNMKNDSSSDEESQRSTSSSILRFRSDDSLANHSKSDAVSKRTRSARTDRYIKRLSRDEETIQDKESDIISRILNKADSDSFNSRQRILSSPQVNGVVHNHEEPEYYEPHKPIRSVPNVPERSYSGTNISQHYRPNSNIYQNQMNFKPSAVNGSNSSVYSYPVGVINFNAKVNDENISYSVPYNSLNKHHQLESNYSQNSFKRSTSVENNNFTNNQNSETDNVMVVKFPLGNMNPSKKENNPPMPPPRDPQRKIPTPLSYMYENTRPLSQHFDQSKQKSIHSKIGENRSNVTTPNNYIPQNMYENAFTNNSTNSLTWMKRPISTSEDHIAMQQNMNNPLRNSYQNDQPRRPSSVTAEVIRPEIYNRYLQRPQINHENRNINDRRNQELQNQDYLYFADKTPRSRKPIHITPNSMNIEEKNANNQQMPPNPVIVQNRPRNASEFWRKMDTQATQHRHLGHNRTLSDQSMNGYMSNNQNFPVKQPQIYSNNNVGKFQYTNGNVENRGSLESRKNISNLNKPEPEKSVKKTIKLDEPVCYSNIDIIPMDDVRKDSIGKSHSGRSSDEEQSKTRRKSTNLEDALSELEAIYNSLGLGDEDLLERAEKRELLTPKTTESYPYSNPKENYFRYPSFTTDVGQKHNALNRRSSIPDKLHDDMAFRRMNPHERPKSKDVNGLVSQVSYMLASPVLTEPSTQFPKSITDSSNNEPDVVFDDVVFRNIRQANNYLKIEDPQPPFGIPVGPITAAPNSDYLHAKPDVKERSQRISQDIPDVVTDDLAYRSLRKDSTNSAMDDGLISRNMKQKNTIPSSAIFDNHVIKKKRAVRSLSANIFTLIQKEIDDAIDLYSNRASEKAQSIPDLPEAVLEFGKSGKLPDNPVPQQNSVDTKYKPTRIVLNDEVTLKTNDRVLGRPPLAVTPEKSPRGPTPVNKLPYSPKLDTDDYFSSAFSNKNEEFSENPFRNEIQKANEAQNLSPIKITYENKYSNNKNKITMDSNVVLYSQVPKNIQIEHTTKIANDNYFHKPLDVSLKYENTERNEDFGKEQTGSKGKSTEDSLLEISNQLKKVENKIKSNAELHNDFEEEGAKLKALAKKCDINLQENLKTDQYTSEPTYKHYIPETSQFSTSNKMPEPIKPFNDSSILKPHISTTDDLEKMPSFDDLRKGINELLDGISHVTDKFNLRKCTNPIENKLYERKDSPIETSLADDDTDKSKDNRGSPEYNSSEELAMIFNLNKDDSSKQITNEESNENEDSHMELNSPKLVKTANQNYKKQPADDELVMPQTSHSIITSSSTNEAPWRRPRQQLSTENGNKGNVQDHPEGREKTTFPQLGKSLISHPSSAFRPVKPSKKVQSKVEPKSNSKFYRERPFFADIKAIARGFGEIIEFPERLKGRCDDDETKRDFGGAHSRMPDDLTKAPKVKERKIRRRATVEGVFREADKRESVPEVLEERQPENESNMSSSIANNDGGKIERIRKYKEERRKQLAEQCSWEPRRSASRLMTKKATAEAANSEAKTDKKPPDSSSPTRQVRTTRTSRLRAAASSGDSPPSKSFEPIRPSEGRSSSRSSGDTAKPSYNDSKNSNALLDTKSLVNRLQVLSNNNVVLNGDSVLVRDENGHPPRGDPCDTESVMKENDNFCDKSVEDDVGGSSKRVNANGSPGLAPAGTATKRPTRLRNKDANDDAVARRGRLASSRYANKIEDRSSPDLNVLGKSASSNYNSRNGSNPLNKRLSNRSSSQSPLSPASATKLQAKKGSLDLVTKTNARNSSTKPSDEDPKPQVNGLDPSLNGKKSVDASGKPLKNNFKLTLPSSTKNIRDLKSESSKASGDSSSDAEPSRVKRRSSSLVNEVAKNCNGNVASDENRKLNVRKMTPGIETKSLKQQPPTVHLDVDKKFSKASSVDSGLLKIDAKITANRRLTSRMDALAALTKETLARVDRLSRKTKNSNKNSDKVNAVDNSKNYNSRVVETKSSDINLENPLEDVRIINTPIMDIPSTSRRVSERLSDIDSATQHLIDFEKQNLSNCADSKSNDANRKQTEPLSSMLSYTPVSILKRKSLQEEHGSSGASTGNIATPPVTFSPNTVDPIPKSRRYGQGILKKRRSLDESQVNRHRSCSPEVAVVDDSQSRPILKSQRRSSLEEVVRGRSPDGQIQGILKRKCSRDGDIQVEDRSLGSPEPQGILKRKSNSSSSSSTASSHVSIAQAVILAAAKGAELVEEKDSVRPILKKKSFSEERPCPEVFIIDGPKPILKKKSLTESDHSDHDKPKKTILKPMYKMDDGNSSSFDHSEEDRSSRRSSLLRNKGADSESESSNVRPILKQRASSHSREHSQSPRPHLSFCSDDETSNMPSLDIVNLPTEPANEPTLPEANLRRYSDEDDSPKLSKFAGGRLQSPSLVKDFGESLTLSPQITGVTLRRREPRSRDANRSRSLVSSFSDELNFVLNTRRSMVDERCHEFDSSKETSPEPRDEAPQSFPSIAERIQCMEKYFFNDPKDKSETSTRRQPRNKERHMTQPITIGELHNISGLEVGQVSFQRPSADRQSSGSGAASGDLVGSYRRLPCDDSYLGPAESKSEQPLSFLHYTKSRLADEHTPAHKFNNSERSYEKIGSFSDLTFSPEYLRGTECLKGTPNANEESPVTKEFNRLFQDSINANAPAPDSLDWNNSLEVTDNSIVSTSDASYNVPLRHVDNGQSHRSRPERPKRLFEDYRGDNTRQAALKELDRLEVEIEDVKVALEADSTALYDGIIDTEHWSLNASADSGVFNRMSSGESGPLSGEEPSLQQDFNKLASINKIPSPFPLSQKSSLDSENTSQVLHTDLSSIENSSRMIPSDESMDREEKAEDATDSPVFGLMKSQSVSAKASLWQQMQMQANKAAVKPVIRHSRAKAKEGSPSVLDRFKTQPITLGEVTIAVNENSSNPLSQSRSSFNLSLEQDDDAKLDENDPAKLTLSEKMKLFGAVVSPKPPSGPKKVRNRFQTMPVLASQVEDAKEMNEKKSLESEKKLNCSLPIDVASRSQPSNTENDSDDDDNKVLSVRDRLNKLNNQIKKNASTSNICDEEYKIKRDLGVNFRLAQNRLAEQASKMLTTEVKGILKSKSGAIPLLPSHSEGNEINKRVETKGRFKMPPSPKNKDDIPTKIKDTNVTRTLTKGESSEGLKDEGIDSSSDDESGSHSSHSSADSCSSSESSDESDDETKQSRHPAPLKPSQIKVSKTESDISKRSVSDDSKSDGRIKLPCMDEMKAREIMERVMSGKAKKETKPQPKQPVTPQPPGFLRKEPLQPKINKVDDQSATSAFVKSKNLKNDSISSKRFSDNLDSSSNTEMQIPGFIKKHIPQSVAKSQSIHAFNTNLIRELKSRKEGAPNPPVQLKGPILDIYEGSGSEGESSGGREVRYINSKRRNLRGVQVTPAVEPPSKWGAGGAPQLGLRRSATQPMAAAMPQRGGTTIAERLAALQQSGNNDWRKRVSRLSPDEDVTNVITATKNRINESLTQQFDEKRKGVQIDPSELSTDILISDRRSKLETSAQGWRKRVGPNDATLFSIAGRMDRDKPPTPVSTPLLSSNASANGEKKTPVPAVFKSRRGESNGTGPLKSASSAAVSQPASPLRGGVGEFRRSVSVSGVDDLTETEPVSEAMTKSQDAPTSAQNVGSSVAVPRADDETFTSFFTSASQKVFISSSTSHIPYNNNNNDVSQLDENMDLDVIDSGSRHLLGHAAANRVRAVRKAGGSKNPLRALAARTDLRQEYTEPPSTGLADKEAARLKKDKLIMNSPMAVEALAGLATKEDFTAVQLKKIIPSSPPAVSSELSTKPLFLIHVKGRRHVQARLVEPHYNNINSGDCFVLVTCDQVFHYAGNYANVIERSRAADIALHIHTTKDLGCVNSTSVITLDEQKKPRGGRHWKQFWTLLGVQDDDVEDFKPVPAGNVDEDEIFESGIISTNMCYDVFDDELVPIQKYWGQIPKIEMLDHSKIIVFDFGTELYVWNGKNTHLETRRRAFQLAKELWDEGYNYKNCLICPLNVSEVLGARTETKETIKKDNQRPEWAMITKVTQHMENILFKDKFLDWPDFTRVIRVKEEEDGSKSGAIEIKPCDVETMIVNEYVDPSLELEGSQVGRGTHYYDKESMRHFEVKTKSVTKWMIQEYDYVKIPEDELGEFYSGDSYILRWEYQLNCTGRELNGNPSKHNLTGRDRCAYFCWQGKDASANEKGAAALLTVELDQEKGPQIRVTQGFEPPAFLNLFKGSFIIHQGKKGVEKTRYRLYMCRGNMINESHLIQVSCSMRQLRSRTSMLLIDTEKGQIFVWHGAKSLKHTKSICLEIANSMVARNNPYIFSSDDINVKVTEIIEGEEPKSVIDALGGANRQLYNSLLDKDNKNSDDSAVTPRLFHFTDLSGQFAANEILSPLRHESLITSYPFSQQELYLASQPGLFLLDAGETLWLWQGWVPLNEDNELIEVGSGVGNIRWQGCRRAAMETVLNYWKSTHPDSKEQKAFVTVAGLEPLEFTNLFDIWQDRDDIAEINIACGHNVGEGVCSVSEELCRLSQTSFPLAVLRQRPLPDAVDPAHIERYLTVEQFEETFGMTKEDFNKLSSWKQANMKKDLDLF